MFNNPYSPKKIPLSEQIQFSHEYGHKLSNEENVGYALKDYTDMLIDDFKR